jgi:prophage antirepressor-like protein
MFWFKAHDIAVFLDYKDTDQAIRKNVPAETCKHRDVLEPRPRDGGATPPYWKPHTVVISEGGLYRLLSRSTKPEASCFEKWVFEEVIPTICETGHYQLEKSFHEQLAIKDKELVKLRDKVLELYDKTAVMTISDVSKHVLRLYRYLVEPNKYIFIRTQSKYLQHAIKTINPEKYELLLNEVNVPNSMNILNRLKEKLSELNISYKDSKNKLTVDTNVLNMVQELLQEPWT